MTVVLREIFSGADSGTATSGTKIAPTVGGSRIFCADTALASPTTGDQYDYIIHFASGDVTLRLVWTSSTAMQFRRISTISGQTFDELMGTATTSGTRPIVGAPFNVSLQLTSSGGDTVFSMGYGRSPHTTNGITGSPFSRTLTGSLTPTGADFAITGSSFAHYVGMEGRVPDGGGEAGLSDGSWKFFVSNGGPEYNKLEVRDEACNAIIGGVDDTIYGVDGLTLPSADYLTRIAFSEGPTLYSTFVSVAGRIQSDGSCYLAQCWASSWDVEEGFVFSLYHYDGTTGSYTNLDAFDNGSDPFVQGSRKIELDCTGSAIMALLYDTDGTTVLATLTASDGTIGSTGAPGLSLNNFDNNQINSQVTLFEVEVADVVVDLCGAIVSRHRFTGTRTDVDGQVTDTYPGQGTWEKHPASGAATLDNDGDGRIRGAGRAAYLDVDIPGLPADYCVSARALYEQVIVGGSPGTDGYWRIIWRDNFDGAAGTPLAGRVHDGGTAGIGTWTRVDSGSASGPGAILDGASRVHNPPAIGSDPGLAAYAAMGLTLPSDGKLRVEIDVYNDGSQVGSDDNRGFCGTLFRYQNGSPVNYDHPLYLEAYYWIVQFSDDPTSPIGLYNHYQANTGAITGSLGGPLAGGQHVDALETATFRTDTRGQGAAPAVLEVNAEGVPAISFYDGQFTARSNFDTGMPGIYMPASYFGNPARIADFRIYEWVPGTPPTGGTDVGEIASIELLVRYDRATDSGLGFRQRFDHSAGGTPVGTHELFKRVAGVETVLATDTRDLAHGSLNLLRVLVAAGLLTGELDGDPILDASGTDVSDFTTGDPGLAGTDLSGTGIYLSITDYIVSAETEPTIPCTGPPENPYPNEYPPIDPSGMLPSVWTVKDGIWEPVMGPGPNVATPEIFTNAQGIAQRLIGLWTMKDGVWQPVEAQAPDQFPPPNTPLPPWADPCETLDPDVNLPPIGDVSPVPYAGGRFFGFQGLPPTLFGVLFNGTQRDGSVPFLMNELAQAAARNGVICAAQGSYKKFISNKYYRPALMDFWIESHAPYATAMLAYQTAGTLAFLSIADDFRGQHNWPTSTATGGGNGDGLSDAELARICAKWDSVVPGLRLGIRARPRVFSGPIPGLTVYITQFDHPQQVGKAINSGPLMVASDYRSFRNAECALLRSWGSGLAMTLHLNYLHGGDGESGITFAGGGLASPVPRYYVSAREVVEASDGWFGDAGGGYDDLIIGSAGYMWWPSTPDPFMTSDPDMPDATAYHHNGLMSLPPL